MRIRKNTIQEAFSYTDMIDALHLMGFDYLEMNFYRRIDELNSGDEIIIYCELYDDSLKVTAYKDSKELKSNSFYRAIDFIDFIETLLKSYGIENIQIDSFDNSDRAITGASTRDFVNKLTRVKSSNVWSYAFQPRDYDTGDMLMQFKGKGGGPGDIYIYYDVPSKLWRKFVAAPSKGHFFWEHIRNVFTYAKLTGDKRTKLANGI